ncbi:MAG: helix-turn-helix transcriptional regulator [Gemmatimonadota bacterium]
MGHGSLGEFEHLVLLATLHLGADAYGVSVAEFIEERTGRRVNQAATYLTLRRLEEKDLVQSSMGEPTPERGGRAKRLFALTESGVVQLREKREELLAMWEGIPESLGP